MRKKTKNKSKKTSNSLRKTKKKLNKKTNIKTKVNQKSKRENGKKNKKVKAQKSLFADTFLVNLIFVTLFVLAIEMIFKSISEFDIISYSTIRILLSSFVLSFIIVFISSITKYRWLRNTIVLLFIFIYTLYSWLQLGFLNFLGVYISFNTTSQIGAVLDYIYDFILSFKLQYYVIFLPFIGAVLFYILRREREYYKINLKKWQNLLIIPGLIICGLLYYLTLTLNFMQNELQTKSNVALFINPSVPTVAVNQFGTAVFGLLDLRTFVFPVNEDGYTVTANYQEENISVTRTVLPVLDELVENDTDSKYANINNYFASQKITDYNEYTGMFAGMNVIVILIESGSYALYNQEYFPNFYKLFTEGWYFENYYSPRNCCATGNNEFSAMTGLYSIYNTCTTNSYKNNTYFESIFGLFNDAGYRTTSMHDFVEWYYYRKISHTNMGSTYYGASDLGIKTAGYYGEWPSDIEFFEKALNIILNDEDDSPWMTWLTTVTAHQPYSVSSTYGDLYKNYFVNEGYSTTVARYLSKLKVDDEALGILFNSLEESGELENTVIVAMPDHYPYGLNQSQVKEMYDNEWDDYEKEKVPFVIYNANMTSQVFSDYTSYVDILPTIANLLNLDYDPRLYMGTDLFSPDHESLVIFSDGSWKNEIAYYNASTGKITYYTEKEYTAEKIQEINTKVDLKLTISTSAIKLNYFNYLEEKISEHKENNVIVETEGITLSTNDDD